MKKYILITIALFISYQSILGQTKALWAAAWSITKAEKIDAILKTAKEYGFNTIYVQTRYRGDALYFPNKYDSTYLNPEQRCYLLKDSDFDPLEYFIEKAKKDSIQIHAWITTLVITPHDLRKIGENHVFYKQNDWLTVSNRMKKITHQEYEGAFFDPSVPEMKNYTINIIKDIVCNYNIDGVQLDYVRYPDSIFGFHPNAVENFNSGNYPDFATYKRNQITNFMNDVYINLKSINPDLEISVAVKADLHEAYSRYSQDWANWLLQNYVDKVVLMAYSEDDVRFQKILNSYPESLPKDKIVVGLRAWSEDKKYHYSKINNKINFIKSAGYQNIGLYSYLGLINNNYLPNLKF